MKRLALALTAVMICGIASAFTRHELAIHSDAMDKNIPVTVLLPDGYAAADRMPAVYLLHGHGDNHKAWADKGQTGALADRYGTILVMPDGGVDSWYWDSPVDPACRYETFVIKELIPYIDRHYKTVADRSGRAITGLSMGGHGALYLAIRHQDTFSAAGSMWGGVDIRPFPNNWGMAKRLGTIDEHPENWESHTVTNMVDRLTPDSLKIIFDCGTGDFFYGVNCALHEKLLKAGIPHDFYQRPGVHNWDYWRNAVQYQMLFFGNWFNSNTKTPNN